MALIANSFILFEVGVFNTFNKCSIKAGIYGKMSFPIRKNRYFNNLYDEKIKDIIIKKSTTPHQTDKIV